jgi:hypothetical protein
MKCLLSISDGDLLAYLDGEGRPDIQAHVATCAACAQRVQDLAASEAHLRQTLYRADCPSAQTLGDYHHGFLNAAEQRAVASHLARCPHCAAELARLDQFLDDIEPTLALSPFDTVRVLTARLMSWGRDAVGSIGLAAPSLGYGAVRGGDDGTRVYHAEGFQIFLDCEADPMRHGRRRIQGLVTRSDGGGAGLFEARLTAIGQAPTKASLDDLGDFAFGGLMPGVYHLTLVGPGLEIRVEGIDLP